MTLSKEQQTRYQKLVLYRMNEPISSPEENSRTGTFLKTFALLIIGLATGVFASRLLDKPEVPVLRTYFVAAYTDGAFVQYVAPGPPFTMVCPSNTFATVYRGKRLNGLKSLQVFVSTNALAMETNAPTVP